MVRPQSALLYRTLAGYRRLLIVEDDLSTGDLREMLGNVLEVCEQLTQALDQFQTTIEEVVK